MPKKTWRVRLGVKASLWISLCTVLIIAGQALLSIPQERLALMEQMDAQGESIAFSFSKAIIPPLLHDDPEELKTMVESLMERNEEVNVAFIRVLEDEEEPPLVEKAISSMAKNSKTYRANIEVGSEDESYALGILEVGIYMIPTQKLMDARLRNAVMELLFILVILVTTIMFLIAQKVSKPLRKLESKALALGEGDLKTPIEIPTGDELGHLAETLDQMRRGLLERDNIIQENVQRLQAVNVAKSNFIATMSHELRTPLNQVIAMLEVLQKENTPEAKQERLLKSATKGSVLLLGILNDILDYSKMEQGRLNLKVTDFNLADKLKRIQEIFLPQAESKGLDLRLEMSPRLPARLIGDPMRLDQILWNLVGNAIKFTDKGAISMKVEKKDSGEGTVELLFSVSDTGIGIPPDKTNSVFESFTQVDSSLSRKHQGTGLGLPIVKGLVKMMKGSIWVNSKLGEGSTFFVLLPLEVKGTETIAPDQLIQKEVDPKEPEKKWILSAEELAELTPLLRSFDEGLAEGSVDETDPRLERISQFLEKTAAEKVINRLEHELSNFMFEAAQKILREIAENLSISMGENDIGGRDEDTT